MNYCILLCWRWYLEADRRQTSKYTGSRRAGFWWFTWFCLTCLQLLSSRSFCCCLFLHYTAKETKVGNACQISASGAMAGMGAEPGLTPKSKFTLWSPWRHWPLRGQSGRKAASPVSDPHLLKAAKPSHWFQQLVQQAKTLSSFCNTALIFLTLFCLVNIFVSWKQCC